MKHLFSPLLPKDIVRPPVLVLAALELPGGDELLAHLAVEGVLDDESIGTWNRTNRRLSDAALTVVLAQFRDGAPDIRLLPLVARTPTEDSNQAFLRLLRSPSQTVRRAALASLPGRVGNRSRMPVTLRSSSSRSAAVVTPEIPARSRRSKACRIQLDSRSIKSARSWALPVGSRMPTTLNGYSVCT